MDNKIIVDLTLERIVFFDLQNPPPEYYDDCSDFAELPYRIKEEEIMNDEHNHFLFKDIMNDYLNRTDAKPVMTFRLTSKNERNKNIKKNLRFILLQKKLQRLGF